MGVRATKPRVTRRARDPQEDAKHRLRTALKPDVGRKRVKRDNRILLRLLVPILLPFAGAALLALHPPVIPDSDADWQAWLDPGFFAFFALVVIAGFIYMANRVLKQWDHSHPDTPEEALGEFYRVASRRKPSARRLGSLIAGFEASAPQVRPVFSWLTATAAPHLDTPRHVAQYWRALLRGNKEVLRSLKLRAMDVEHPLPDVGVASLKLEFTVVRKLQAALSALAGLAIFVVPFALGAEFIRGYGMSFWTAVVAAGALGFGVAWVLRKLFKAVVERREVAINKLLVRTSYNWVLVYGELESQDENDLAWLDTFKP